MNLVCRKCFIIFSIVVVANANVGEAQTKFRDQVKRGESNVKQGSTAPEAISSRFLDLGGVISQLFSGFNQGSGAGGAGSALNLPPNSQFYPGVPGQSGNSQLTTNQGSTWPMFSQGNNPSNGYPNQQPWNVPNQNSFNANNLQPGPNPGWQTPQNVNNQNNNANLFQSGQNQGSQTMGQLTNPPYPGQGKIDNSGPTNNGMSSRNEGTLDDFFTTQGPVLPGNGNNQFVFRDNDESGETATKVAILGKKVVLPSTTPSNNIIFKDSGETPTQKQCVQNCPSTTEYNPVCGTDTVTYFNPSRLICARNCGINVFEARRGKCRR